MRFIALAEDYPDLKANQSFLDLQKNLTDVENHIQYARRYYNGTVRNLNIRIDSLPDMLIARIFRFVPAEFFDFEEAV
ncbi:MAG: LemA family protein [Proteobacteria bacterium]|nr:LemA family protein [Pseudomonadota bacterium]